MKATPRPWRWVHATGAEWSPGAWKTVVKDTYNRIAGPAEEEVLVYAGCGSHEIEVHNPADAIFLIRAVNAHEALVAALRQAHDCATLREDGTCDGCFVSAALKRAEEDTP